MFRLRVASIDRAAEIAALYVRTRRVAYAPFFPQAALDAMSVDVESVNWRRRLGASDGETVVALDDRDAVAGFAHLAWRESETLGTGEIEYMYVATEHQGNGLGARLMAEAESRLAASGCLDGVLWVYEANRPARGFYARCAWQDDGARRMSGSAPGQFLARYRKRLGV